MKQETKEMKSVKPKYEQRKKNDHAISMDNKKIKIAAINHLQDVE